MKPKPRAYYEARELIAELYGLSPDPEPLPAMIQDPKLDAYADNED